MVGKSIRCSIAALAKRIDFLSFPKVIKSMQSYNFFGYFLRNQIFTFPPRTNCFKRVQQITRSHKGMMASYSFAMLHNTKLGPFPLLGEPCKLGLVLLLLHHQLFPHIQKALGREIYTPSPLFFNARRIFSWQPISFLEPPLFLTR